VSFAQFQDNVFEQDKSATSQHRSGADVQGDAGQSSSGTLSSADDDDGSNPGNPGNEPVPIDDFLPFLFLTGLVFIIYYKGKSKKINI